MTTFKQIACSLVSTCLLGAAVLACSSDPPGTSGDSASDSTGSGNGGTAGNTGSGGSGGSTGNTGGSSSSGGGGATSSSSTGGGIPPTTFDESACTIFVDAATGLDANGGHAKNDARKTIAAAVSIVKAGDTVCVYPGAYGAFKNTVSGTDAKRIHFVSVERWEAKVTSSMAPIQNLGNYVDIDGFEVTTPNELVGVGISNGDGKLAEHCRIFNNHVYGITAKTGKGKGGAGILSAGWVTDQHYRGTDVEIFNNFVHDIGNTTQYASLVQGIYIAHPHAKIYNNIVYNVSGVGIHGWHNANYVEVTNNLTSNTGGIVLGNGDDPCNDPKVYKCPFTDYFVTNNILYHDRAGIYLYPGPNHVISNNDFYMTTSIGMNALTVDPQLVGYALAPNADFHLEAMSPMINAGLSTHAPAIDFDGKARPQGGSPDIGPFQH